MSVVVSDVSYRMSKHEERKRERERESESLRGVECPEARIGYETPLAAGSSAGASGTNSMEPSFGKVY